ncbi:MAG: alpha/beta fold hydrolase [Planctomycetota bacterium]
MSEGVGTREHEVMVRDDRKVRISIDSPGAHSSQAKDILFIPGFKGFKDWGGWPWFCGELALAGHRVVRMNPSMCGVGASLDTFDEPQRFARQTLGHDVEDIEAVLGDDALGLDGPILLGHSRGGLVAAISAREYPAIAGVITMGTPGDLLRLTEDEIEMWRATGRREIVNARTGEVLHQDVEVLEDYLMRQEFYSAPSALAQSNLPVLAIHGGGDEAVDPSSAGTLLAEVDPDLGRKVIIEGAGHTFGLAHPFAGPHPHARKAVEVIVDWLREERSG